MLFPKRWIFCVSQGIVVTWFLTFLAGNVTAGDNFWSNVGPHGGNVRDIIIHPQNRNLLYVTVFTTGVFKSEDGGKQWICLNDSVLTEGGYDLEFDPQNPNIIYLSGYDGVFKSQDAGHSWQFVTEENSNNIWRDLEINPFNPQEVLCAQTGLYKSTDEGITWKYLSFGNLGGFCVEYDRMREGFIYYAANFSPRFYGTGIFKSVDGGKTWGNIISGLEDLYIPNDLKIDPQNPDVVYVVGFNVCGSALERLSSQPYRSIFKSEDGGQSWYCINNNLKASLVWKIAIDPNNPHILYVCTDDQGLWKSTDGGKIWKPQNNGLCEKKANTVIIDAVMNTLYLGTANGSLYKSTNGGGNWQDIGQEIKGRIIYSVAINPKNSKSIYVGTSNYPYLSTDEGKTWHPVRIDVMDTTQQSVKKIVIDPLDTSIVYLALDSNTFPNPSGAVYLCGGFFKSIDNGKSWRKKTTGLPDQINGSDMDVFYDSTCHYIYLATTHKGVFKSDDRGESWQEAGLADSNIVNVIVDPVDARVVYACTFHNVFKTQNSGQSWQVCSSQIALSNPGYWNLYIHPHNPQQVFVANHIGLYISEDRGQNWKLLGDQGTCLSIDPENPELFYMGTMSRSADPASPSPSTRLPSKGVLVSEDGGLSWTEMNNGWHKPEIMVIESDRLNHSTIYAGTLQNSLYAYTRAPTKVSTEDIRLMNFLLYSNYPNPFNSQTKVRYYVPTTGQVTLRIFDIQGREVAMFEDAPESAGDSAISWNGKDRLGRDVASGIYLYSVRFRDWFLTKKMALIR